VWHSSLTQGQVKEIERVQKVAMRIILKEEYDCYENALEECSLQTLSERRDQLCLSFAKNCTKNERTKDIFSLKTQLVNTRNPEKYEVTKAKTNRLAMSAIPSMQRQLNRLNSNKK
jgi:hypothetical protein